jgi:hypothetical protein
MDQETIDTAVLFPTSAFHMTRLAEKDYAAAYCRAYNNWIAQTLSGESTAQRRCSRAVPERSGSGGGSPSCDDEAQLGRSRCGFLRHEGTSRQTGILADLRRAAKTERALIGA